VRNVSRQPVGEDGGPFERGFPARRVGVLARAVVVEDERANGRPAPASRAAEQAELPAHCERISISAWRSRSTYGSPLTSTATRSILPPVKAYGGSPG
jgi:hypothetical protein